MATIKNILMKQKNSSDYDTIYPITEETYTNVTMTSGGWSSSQYSFESDYPNSKYNISVSVASTATSAQFDAFGKAKIVGNATTNVVKALGTVPTQDIPVMLKITRKA